MWVAPPTGTLSCSAARESDHVVFTFVTNGASIQLPTRAAAVGSGPPFVDAAAVLGVPLVVVGESAATDLVDPWPAGGTTVVLTGTVVVGLETKSEIDFENWYPSSVVASILNVADPFGHEDVETSMSKPFEMV